MFTGIITEIGTISSVRGDSSGYTLRVEAPATVKGLMRGGSVAVDGVCLTAVAIDRTGFAAQVIPETARRSTLGTFSQGRKVNLERPLASSGELAGHFVQGHVDACATIKRVARTGGEVVLEVQLPAALKGLLVEKGSIAINGVSLTVAAVKRSRPTVFRVALIPHTLTVTNLGGVRSGMKVNLEADILGKYVQTLLSGKRA